MSFSLNNTPAKIEFFDGIGTIHMPIKLITGLGERTLVASMRMNEGDPSSLEWNFAQCSSIVEMIYDRILTPNFEYLSCEDVISNVGYRLGEFKELCSVIENGHQLWIVATALHDLKTGFLEILKSNGHI